MDSHTHSTRAGRIAATSMVAWLVLACSSGSTGSTVSPPPATSNQPSAAGPAANDQPVTLRLAIADPRGRQVEPVVEALVDAVANRSNGNITIAPTFDAASGAAKVFEEGVADMVERGDSDLGIAASRVWDLAGVTSLQALQAPFLIDTDALALAVARSDIAKQALGGMSTAGVEGLAIWQEGLRHPFSYPKCGKDFRSVAAFDGSTVLMQPSALSRAYFKAIGAKDWTGSDREAEAEACTLQGQEVGFDGAYAIPVHDAVGTGNVVLFPKYQVLVANTTAFARLSESQQSILREAAADAQIKADANKPNDSKLAAAWCAQGGTVVTATPAQVTEFVEAAKPVYDSIERDPLTKDLIARIRDLKATTTSSSSVTPCEPGIAATPSFMPTDGYVGTALPTGTYRIELTREGQLAAGNSAKWAAANFGVWTWIIGDGTWSLTQRDGGGNSSCGGSWTSNGDFIHLGYTENNCDLGLDFVWRLDGDTLKIVNIHMEDWAVQDIIDYNIFNSFGWTKIE